MREKKKTVKNGAKLRKAKKKKAKKVKKEKKKKKTKADERDEEKAKFIHLLACPQRPCHPLTVPVERAFWLIV